MRRQTIEYYNIEESERQRKRKEIPICFGRAWDTITAFLFFDLYSHSFSDDEDEVLERWVLRWAGRIPNGQRGVCYDTHAVVVKRIQKFPLHDGV